MIKNKKEDITLQMKKRSQFKETVRRFKKNKLGVIGVVVITLFVFLMIFAGVFGSYEESVTQNPIDRLLPPSSNYWFGTDNYGRDVFLRCVYGSRISLGIGLSATIITAIIGVTIGMTAGYYGGAYDTATMRFFDLLSSIPTTLLSITIVAALGSSVPNLIAALTISRIGGNARIARASVLGLTGQEYVEAAHAGGTSDFRIITRHLFPNILAPVLVNSTNNMSRVILNISTLSFLGLGVGAPAPEWGAIIAGGKAFLRTRPNIALSPGLFIILATMSVKLIGDGLRDALDPRLKS